MHRDIITELYLETGLTSPFKAQAHTPLPP
jgi:hypothetical protein